jgi:hypothetical protein
MFAARPARDFRDYLVAPIAVVALRFASLVTVARALGIAINDERNVGTSLTRGGGLRREEYSIHRRRAMLAIIRRLHAPASRGRSTSVTRCTGIGRCDG